MLGPTHPYVATTLSNLAALYEEQRQYAQAEPLYQRALAILEQALGPEHPQVVVSIRHYATLLRQTNRIAEADKLEARAQALSGQRPREPDPVPCTACQP